MLWPICLTPIRYISGKSRSVISGKKKFKIYFSVIDDVIHDQYFMTSNEINHLTSSLWDIKWWKYLLPKIWANVLFEKKTPEQFLCWFNTDRCNNFYQPIINQFLIIPQTLLLKFEKMTLLDVPKTRFFPRFTDRGQ